ncbi:MAG: hydroxyacylglutathione hydrolase [Candidatus Tectimicrobiota bacterium]|nr:MAG: hydroxyacylglutathione hydrolase [Candidatus Tectomicrobia bacterium]
MIFEQLPAGGDRNFCYLIGDAERRLGAVVDPGYDTTALEARVRELGLQVMYVFNTHTHHDHIAGNAVFLRQGAKLAAYKEARVNPEVKLDHGDELFVGRVPIKVLFTPGHYLDAICLLVAGRKLITGDTLFVGCIGGTGFQGSSAEKQFHSLFEILLKLDDAVEVYPGHDYGPTPSSTIGHERRHNPFLQRTNFEDFLWLKAHWEEYKAAHGIP